MAAPVEAGNGQGPGDGRPSAQGRPGELRRPDAVAGDGVREPGRRPKPSSSRRASGQLTTRASRRSRWCWPAPARMLANSPDAPPAAGIGPPTTAPSLDRRAEWAGAPVPPPCPPPTSRRRPTRRSPGRSSSCWSGSGSSSGRCVPPFGRRQAAGRGRPAIGPRPPTLADGYLRRGAPADRRASTSNRRAPISRWPGSAPGLARRAAGPAKSEPATRGRPRQSPLAAAARPRPRRPSRPRARPTGPRLLNEADAITAAIAARTQDPDAEAWALLLQTEARARPRRRRQCRRWPGRGGGGRQAADPVRATGAVPVGEHEGPAERGGARPARGRAGGRRRGGAGRPGVGRRRRAVGAAPSRSPGSPSAGCRRAGSPRPSGRPACPRPPAGP